MSTSIRTFAVALLIAALSAAGPTTAFAETCPPGQTLAVDAAGATVCVATSETTPSPGTTTTVSDASASMTVSSTGTISVTETTVTATTSSGSVTTDGTTTTLSAPTVTATTTGTTATASVPTTTVTVGTMSGGSSPDLSNVSTGSGEATVDRGVSTSGSGLAPSETTASTSLTAPDSEATVMVSDNERLDQGASASVGVNEPVTGTTLSGAAGAHALICLLAQANVDPTRAALSTLCGGGSSSLDGTAGLSAANAPTGTTVTTGAALRAAICLLTLVASPLPGTISSAELASASLSTLCGGGPSTVGGGSDIGATNDRTGTDVAAAPIVAAAICILANGTVGDPTVAQLSSLCAPATDGGGTPSTIDASAPVQATDATTGTSADLAPAASAAICILLDALAQIPATASEPALSADLSTACGGAIGGTTPSDITATAPTTASTTGGPDIDVAPSVNAAVCILTTAQASAGGASLAVTDACAGTAAVPPGGPASAPAASATPANGSAPAGDVSAAVAGQEAAPLVGTGQAGVRGEADVPATIAGLPSTSTAAAGGMFLVLATIAAMAAIRRRRRSS